MAPNQLSLKAQPKQITLHSVVCNVMTMSERAAASPCRLSVSAAQYNQYTQLSISIQVVCMCTSWCAGYPGEKYTSCRIQLRVRHNLVNLLFALLISCPCFRRVEKESWSSSRLALRVREVRIWREEATRGQTEESRGFVRIGRILQTPESRLGSIHKSKLSLNFNSDKSFTEMFATNVAERKFLPYCMCLYTRYSYDM
jgi:hypothetical protein